MIEEQKSIRLTQTETNYTPLSAMVGKACASCRWFNASGEYGAYCHLIDNWPLDVLATGLCDRHEPLPNLNAPPVSETLMENAITAVAGALDAALSEAAGKADDEQSEVVVTITDNQGGAQSIVKRVKNLFAAKPDTSPFQVFKAEDGTHHWIACHTNIFEDRDSEILSSKAHAAYIARINMGLVDMPELWSYHTKGTRHGQADLVWEHAGFVYALGHFDDTPEAQQAVKAYQKRKGKIELSHGFTYPRWALKDGVYSSYNTFEISTLPEGAASNPYTEFEEIINMSISDKQAKWIKETLGEEALKRVEAAQGQGEKNAEVLKALDKRYKDFADLETPTDEDVKALEVSKTVGTVLGSLIAAQAELAEKQDTEIAAKSASETELKAKVEAQAVELVTLKAQIATLTAAIEARPKSASQATETQISPNEIPDAIKQGLVQKDSFWGTDVLPG